MKYNVIIEIFIDISQMKFKIEKKLHFAKYLNKAEKYIFQAKKDLHGNTPSKPFTS